MATKNNPGAFDCYANAEPDEPMFVLLGRDRHGPTLVWLWAVLRELDQEDPAKVEEARDLAMQMIAYQHSKGKKACGLAQAAMAGTIELVRVANAAARKAGSGQNEETRDEVFRRWLCQLNLPEEDGETRPA